MSELSGVSNEVVVEQATVDAVVVRLVGEHDLAERGELRALLASLVEANTVVVADLSETTFVDSTILHVLVETDHAARRLGRSFRVQLATTAIVARAFELTGLGARLRVVRTRAAALAEDTGPR